MIKITVLDTNPKIITPKLEKPVSIDSNSSAVAMVIEHADLLKRDADDSHPISAITDLQDELDSKASLKDVSDISKELNQKADIENEHFNYEQTVSSAIWEIEHNLGRYPSVTVVDSAGTVVYGDITYINENTIKLTFSGEFSGKAYLN